MWWFDTHILWDYLSENLNVKINSDSIENNYPWVQNDVSEWMNEV